MNINISIVSPVFDENESLRPLVKSIQELIKEYICEIIIVYHPNSEVGCLNILKEIEKDYPKLKIIPQDLNEPGNGSAYRQGFKLVRGTHILMIDSDGEMDVNTIPNMIKIMETTNADLVIASRYMKGGGIQGQYPPLKLFLNRIFQYIFRVLYWTKINDLTYGFKLMKVNIINNLSLEAKYQHIGVETTLKPIKYGYKVEQVPTIHRFRESGMDHSLSLFGNLRYPYFALKILLGKKKNESCNNSNYNK